MADLEKLALKLATEGPHKVLPTPRMVKILFGGAYIAKTTEAIFVWEHPWFTFSTLLRATQTTANSPPDPQFYIPSTAIQQSSSIKLEESSPIKGSNGTVLGHQCKLTSGEKSTAKVISFSASLTGPGALLAGLVKIDFGSMDQWFEEDTPIYVHPKDPFKRIDTLHSNRPVRVSLNGHVIASAVSSVHLYETGLPCRFYVPLSVVDPEVLRPSETKTLCPYKGESEYYDVEVGGERVKDVFWYYRNPVMESAAIAGLVCPYNEKVDIELDGVKLERPKTHFA